MLGVFLSSFITKGTLTVIWPDGKRHSYGSGNPCATIQLHGRFTPVFLALRSEMALGEAYMGGRLTVEEGDIGDVLQIVIASCAAAKPPRAIELARLLRRWTRILGQFNPPSRSQRNVAHHYDLSGELYDLFLDADRQYSCAYFHNLKDPLEAAQAAKKVHIASKLCLDNPGLKVLDIGSGWGGLALELAKQFGADVTGVTLSVEQLALARSRAKAAGLAEHCRFELQDYRAVNGPYDRIVSVGMFEHVGIAHYDAFFGKVRDLLADDGVALLHTIGRTDGPGATNPWITKYIFPGGYCPALSEIMPAIEKAGLIVTDIEVLRLHYAETLKAWRTRFRKNWARAAALYDQRFCRMWEFYLAGSEMTFRYDRQAVFQIQLAKCLDTLPVTRDYMFESERSTRFAARAHEAA